MGWNPSDPTPHLESYIDPATGETKTAMRGDVGFAGPTRPSAPIKTHSTTGGVLAGAHMGGHSDVAGKPAPKPVAKAPIKKAK